MGNLGRHGEATTLEPAIVAHSETGNLPAQEMSE